MLRPFTTYASPLIRKLNCEKFAINRLIKGYNLAIKPYLILSKHRLSAFVALTGTIGYFCGPGAISLKTAFYTLNGILLASFSANSMNQLLEAHFDRRMNRTCKRPLITGKISLLGALNYSILCASASSFILLKNTTFNSTLLSIANIVIYTFIYTPLKRYSTFNTSIGAIVGAIPPLIGFLAHQSASLNLNAFILPAYMYFWQFCHFNALSMLYQNDYANAGYKLYATQNIPKLLRVSFLSPIFIQILLSLSYYYSMIPLWCLGATSAINQTLIYYAIKFCKNPDAKTSKNLFLMTLPILPITLSIITRGIYANRKFINSEI